MAPVPSAPVEDFNEGLEASIAGVSEDGVRRLQETFGDYVKVDGGRIRWDAAKTREEPDELRALPVPERLAARRQEFARGAGAKPPGFPPSGWSQLVQVGWQGAAGSRPAPWAGRSERSRSASPRSWKPRARARYASPTTPEAGCW